MSETLSLILPLVAGVFLGMLFFGCLWWTIHICASAKRPALCILGSLLLRTSIVLLGFYFVALGHWERFIVSLLGFLVARVIVVRLVQAQEVGDASYP